jgi:arginase
MSSASTDAAGVSPPPGAALDLITVPFNSSARPGGVARMPAALLDAGLGAELAGSRVVAVDLPPSEPHRGATGLLAEAALTAMVSAVADRVLDAWAADRLPVVIGGDCPVLLGGLVAARHRGYDAGLVFVDGHEDAWDPPRSTTGEAADSEIALALGWAEAPPGLGPVLPCLSPSALVQLGPRDAAELAAAGRPSIADRVSVLPGEQFAAPDGPATAVALAAELVSRHEHWWLHIDLDVLATQELAAVDYPQPGGLSWTQLEAVTEAVLNLGGCGGLSVTVYNPDLDHGAAAAQIAAFVAAAARRLVARSA